MSEEQGSHPLDENGYPMCGAFRKHKQTPVEWLIEQVEKGEVAYGMFWVRNFHEIFKQAKQMEEEQLLDKYGEGYDEGLYDALNK